MDILKTIQPKISELADCEFEFSHTSDFNFIRNLDTDCNGIVMEATVIYFNIKNVSLLLKTGKRLAARFYKIYYHILTELCRETGGQLNCYAPDGFLLIYPKEEFEVSYVVDNAIKTAELISVSLRESIEKLGHINFSMGIDKGNILGTRVVDSQGFHQITWFGSTINKAKVISGGCNRPFFVGVSGSVFHHLDEDLKVATKRIIGIKKQVELWTRVSYEFENVKHHYYQTNFLKKFEGE